MHNTFKQYLFLIFICIGSLNIAAIASEQDTAIEAPQFSHASGFYPEEFKLKITHPDPKAKIYYTLDGSTPDPNNLKGSTFQYKNHYAQPPNKPSGELLEMEYRTYPYVKPLHIKDRTFEPDRISQISTTFDENPDYFPEPKVHILDTWTNQFYRLLNKPIKLYNRLAEKINWFLNGVKHRFGLFFKGLAYQHIPKNYLGSLALIELESIKEYLYKGTPIRAIAVKGEMQSRIEEGIYFIGDRDQFSLPIVNITVPEKDLFDYEEGFFVAGKKYDDFLMSGKVIKNSNFRTANWRLKGENIISTIFLFNEHQRLDANIVDLRVHGNASRAFRNKSLRIYPRKKYSEKGLDFPVFDNNSSLGLTRFNLRNAGNAAYTNYLGDAAVQKAFQNLHFGTQDYKPYIVFINGEYQGILNAREKIDQYLLQRKYNLTDKAVDIIKKQKEIQKGDDIVWQQLKKYIREADTQNDSFYTKVLKRIDLCSFYDYFAAEIFIANLDWPGNNIRQWRYRSTDGSVDKDFDYEDGRWRWFMYDIDFMGRTISDQYQADHNSLYTATDPDSNFWSNPPNSTFLLRTLLENSLIREEFIQRFSDLLNTVFLSDRMEMVIRDAEKGIEKEMPRHIERWKTPKSMKHWRNSVNNLVNFFHERPKYQWQHLEEFFNLEGRYQVNVAMALEDASFKEGGDFGRIKLNTLTIGEPKPQNPDVTYTDLALPWQGDYFKNLPLVVEAIPAEGYTFSHWEAEGMTLTEEEQKSLKLRIQPERDLQLRAVVIEAKGK